MCIRDRFVAGAASCESEEPSVGGIDWVDAALFDKFDYVALGHLHSPQKVGPVSYTHLRRFATNRAISWKVCPLITSCRS